MVLEVTKVLQNSIEATISCDTANSKPCPTIDDEALTYIDTQLFCLSSLPFYGLSDVCTRYKTSSKIYISLYKMKFT